MELLEISLLFFIEFTSLRHCSAMAPGVDFSLPSSCSGENLKIKFQLSVVEQRVCIVSARFFNIYRQNELSDERVLFSRRILLLNRSMEENSKALLKGLEFFAHARLIIR